MKLGIAAALWVFRTALIIIMNDLKRCRELAEQSPIVTVPMLTQSFNKIAKGEYGESIVKGRHFITSCTLFRPKPRKRGRRSDMPASSFPSLLNSVFRHGD